jgi:protein-S-isoprenylcysteine O-methyltransferase Ste14
MGSIAKSDWPIGAGLGGRRSRADPGAVGTGGARRAAAHPRPLRHDRVMRWLETRIPPPIVAGIVALGMWLAAPAAARALASSTLRLCVALAIALVGGAIAFAGSRAFKRVRTTINPLRPEKASALVTGGVYRLTRNPMYLGLTFVLVGFGFWLRWWPAVLGPIAFVGYITRFQILPEERALGARFGAPYAAYRERVRRWL